MKREAVLLKLRKSMEKFSVRVPESFSTAENFTTEYPGASEPVSLRPITDDDLLLYFAKYTNASLGKLKNLCLNWARSLGPMSLPCQELNWLFSTCVDGNRIKIPPKLESFPSPDQKHRPLSSTSFTRPQER
ncbi:hypothetical protein ColLi_09238 [Colletotrichum liriopes]|uniref:Uncharacterized protein n=1 Tax=Colletotrichum liriopes TaxID=708192 RepID=A0AA37GTD4_9PEZI|nr:hypothetical protein ColLi_09238 [Colletotrichum liriopes]